MKDEKKLILSIDCGTQSLRAIIFDLSGNIVEYSKIEYDPYFSKKPGYAEQTAETYWQALIKALKELSFKLKDMKKVAGIGITTQRDTLIAVDENGKPLHNAILWLDQRKSSPVYKPAFPLNIVFKLIGMDEAIYTTQSEGKINWIKEFKPEIYKKVYKFLQVSGYLNFKLTGKFKDSVASQIGHIPFNYKKLRWAKKSELSYKLFPVNKNKLPELVNPGEIIGYVKPDIARELGLSEKTPVIAVGSDKGCETIGMGVISPDKVNLSFGTTATVQTTIKKYVEPIKFMPSYPAVIKGYFNPEVEIFRGFWLLRWFKEEFAHKEIIEAEKKGISPEIILNNFLKEVPPGSLGLIVLPYWSPGLKIPEAKGAMIGFGDIHRKPHIYRAVVEGLAFGLYDGMKKIEKVTKTPVKKVTVSGGASQSDEICQIAADIFGLPIYKGKTHETSALGAAIITAYALNFYDSITEAIESMVEYKKEFLPDHKNHKLYKKVYNNIYSGLYKSLKPFYIKIREIFNYPEKLNK